MPSANTAIGVFIACAFVVASGNNLVDAYKNKEILFLSGDYGAKVSSKKHPKLLFWLSVLFWLGVGLAGLFMLYKLSTGTMFAKS